MATKTIFITSGTTFTVPLDFGSIVSIEAIGGGGGGSTVATGNPGGGGGGGAYAKSTAVAGLGAGQTTYVSIGAGGARTTNGGNTWFNITNTAPTLNTTGVLAVGGNGGVGASDTPGTGGANTSCIGTSAFSGGSGGSG
jgi:hypothetical protein